MSARSIRIHMSARSKPRPVILPITVILIAALSAFILSFV